MKIWDKNVQIVWQSSEYIYKIINITTLAFIPTLGYNQIF